MVLIPFSSASNQCSGIANLRWRGISHLQGHAISCVAWIVHPMSDGIQQMYALRAAAPRLAGESACPTQPRLHHPALLFLVFDGPHSGTTQAGEAFSRPACGPGDLAGHSAGQFLFAGGTIRSEE